MKENLSFIVWFLITGIALPNVWKLEQGAIVRKESNMNDIKQLFTEVKSKVRIEDYAAVKLQKAQQPAGSYVCPACGSGGRGSANSDSALHIDKNKQLFHCHACDAGGDVFGLAGILKGTDNRIEQLKEVADFAGIRLDLGDYKDFKSKTKSPSKIQQQKKTEEEIKKLEEGRAAEHQKLIQFQVDIQDNKINAPAVSYLEKRGISLKDAVRCGVGYDSCSRRVVVPCVGSEYYHFDRAIDENTKIKHMKPKSDEVGSQPLYNPAALNSDVVVLVEGEFDALTLRVLGFDNVIMTGGGTSCLSTILQRINGKPSKPTFLLFFDQDEKGDRFTTTALEQFQNVGAKAVDIRKSLELQGKDANEMYLNHSETIRANLLGLISNVRMDRQREIKEAYESTLLSSGIVSNSAVLLSLVEQTGLAEPIPTGFSKLDEKLNGGFQAKQLITLGATSSIGKTSWFVQVAHNMASAGVPVLYVSIEPSPIELFAKMVSMYTYFNRVSGEAGIPYKTLLIKDNDRLQNVKIKNQIDRATKELYVNLKDKLQIQSSINSRPTVRQIKENAQKIAEFEGKPPVIFIDYLQLLEPVSERDQERQIVDKNLTALKQMANALNTPVALISSINRASYCLQVEFESFKESGAIEYSSDVVLGLQPAQLAEAEEQAKGEGQKKAMRNCLRESKSESVSDVTFRILKHRNGKCDLEGTLMKFDKSFSYFKEVQILQ
jgi:replicative DNA helicase